jgi:hypothetical protein
MPRKLRFPKARTEPLPLVFQHFLLHGDRDAALAADPEAGAFDLFVLDSPTDGGRHTRGDVWAAVRDELLAAWIAERPGTRPWAWWLHDAPAWTTDIPTRARPLAIDYAHVWQLKQPRKRLGGRGTAIYEALNYVPRFHFGLPTAFVSASDVAYYNGRSRDIHGHRIGAEYRDGDFPYHAIDPADPPRFESQAAYLQRHGFLSDAERRRLPADAFAPECIACA